MIGGGAPDVLDWIALATLMLVLPVLTVALIIFFSLLLPRTFQTYLNFRSILADLVPVSRSTPRVPDQVLRQWSLGLAPGVSF